MLLLVLAKEWLLFKCLPQGLLELSSALRIHHIVCYSCGEKGHQRNRCRHRDKICNKCNKQGHISKACKRPNVSTINAESDEIHDEIQDDSRDDRFNYSEELYTVNDVNSVTKKDIVVPVRIGDKNLQMQLDTGCAYSLAPKTFYDKYCSNIPLNPTSLLLSTYTGETIYPLGEANVKLEISGKQYILPLIIVPQGTNPLFGRNWLTEVRLDWSNLPGLKHIQQVPPTTTCNYSHSMEMFTLDSVLHKYNGLFKSSLGCYNGTPANLKVKKDPPFQKARPVPYALKSKVETALQKMESEGVIEKVTTATCAAPIVVVGKKNCDDVRICGDFSVTYNSCADVETYPLPKIEDLHEAMRGCKVFSILDMSQAYHQIPISQESQPFLTINTHVGLFSFKRLPNGVHSGPAIFQRIMDSTLAGIPNVVCYIDDILVAGVDSNSHINNLSQVFDRLSSAGFQLKKSKCEFEKSSVQYLGHIIDGEGLHPTEDKLKAVRDAPSPTNVTSLKSFLGLIMFYSRFLKNHSTVLAPLNNLLKKNVHWKWTRTEEEAFVNAKKLLVDSKTLVHYDDSLPLYLACDASSYGAGAVLSHYIDGVYRPIAFASCTLTKAQCNYSQMDKEAFSIIFGLKRFRQYLLGRIFTILTDHRPLLTLFGPDRPVPVHAAARIQRWALILQSYNYKIMYRNTAAHIDADFVSRLPLPKVWSPQSANVDCYFLEEEGMSNVTSEMIKKATAADPKLSRVHKYTVSGWPSVVDPSLIPYKHRQDELSVEQGCLLLGTRVVVPPSLQVSVLKELHETHPGMTRMKGLARSYVWWPRIDIDIEHCVSSCKVCQSMRSNPPNAPVHPWIFPSKPWSRIHIDFAGPVAGCMYLVLVDAYSKYPEVVKMNTTTSKATINVLREIFSRQGLPEILVSDNGPQFTSYEFQEFCTHNGILHRTSSPYKPSTNGQAERVVQILKSALKQAQLTGKSVDTVLPRYLLTYRNTPHSTTGESPAMLLMKRRLRTRLDLLTPSVHKYVESKQNSVLQRSSQRLRSLQVGDQVMIRNYMGEKWIEGDVIKVLGSRHYIVNAQGREWKRHIDQLIKCSRSEQSKLSNEFPVVQPTMENTTAYGSSFQDIPTLPVEDQSIQRPTETDVTQTVHISNQEPIPVTRQQVTDLQHEAQATSVPDIPLHTTTERRYPARVRLAPSYLKDYTC